MEMLKSHQFLFFSLVFFFLSPSLLAQDPIKVSLVSDNFDAEGDVKYYEQSIKEEIQLLLRNRFTVDFDVHYGGYDAANIFGILNDLFANEETDIIIAMGSLSAGVLAQFNDFRKPSIASIIIDQELQQIPKTEEGTSGIQNFTYVESPFNIERDVQALYELYAFEKLVVLGGTNLLSNLPFLDELMTGIQEGRNFSYSIVRYEGDVEASIAEIAANGDAVYVLPLFGEMSSEEGRTLFDKLNEKGIPSAALFGEEYIGQGALLGFEAETNLQRMPRRIAINISKMVGGTNAADLPVVMPIYNENLLINMAAARKSGVYPSFDLMSTATLVNFNKVETDRKLSLQGAITEGLQNNLGLRTVAIDPKLA